MSADRNVVTFQGEPLTLVGQRVPVGSATPNVELIANDLSVVRLVDYRSKACVLSSVPSLDTSVCDAQTRRFNQEAASLGEAVRILTISMDLPFAQARWCGAAGIDRVQTLSDHRDAAFGRAYGLLIDPMRLLARAVLVVDAEGVLRYEQVVGELTHQVDFESALDAIRSVNT